MKSGLDFGHSAAGRKVNIAKTASDNLLPTTTEHITDNAVQNLHIRIRIQDTVVAEACEERNVVESVKATLAL